jgi:phosphoribosylformimino-5-aminoimidazole carboxamide ribotide isomerase
MRITPRLDMAGGESVHSLPNPEDPERPWDDAPSVAMALQRAGAARLHVVDVDRATETGDNDDILVQILDKVDIPVDAGGGVRSMRRIQELLDTGIRRVILSTMGVQHPDWLKEVGGLFGKKVVLAVDIQEDQVRVKGRKEPATLDLEAFLTASDDYGLGAILLNTCDRRPRPDIELLATDLSGRAKTPLWLGGAALTMADLDHWAKTSFTDAIVGPEIYDGRLDLEDALKRFPGPV